MNYRCDICNVDFDKFQQKANHDRWNHKSKEFRDECIEKLRKATEDSILLRRGSLKEFEVSCWNCNKSLIITEFELKFSTERKYFCSRSCSNSRKFNEKVNNKRKEKFKKNFQLKEVQYQENPKLCIECFLPKSFDLRHKRFCSLECSNKSRSRKISESNRNNPNCGGETNYLKFKYNGIWMDSSWEVRLAEFLDRYEIEWVRSKRIWFRWIDENNVCRRYHPDFYLPKYEVYLDPKNPYLTIKDEYKIEYVKTNSKINIIYGDINKIEKFVYELVH